MTVNALSRQAACTSRRYLALWFPYLATERLKRLRKSQGSSEQDDPPRATVEKIRGAVRLAAADVRAARLGLAPGLTLADARARVPQLIAMAADPEADAVFLKNLAAACERFTPSICCDAPTGLILDITGCAHLLGGEAGLKTRVESLFSEQNLSVRAAIASTPEAARALVRSGWRGVTASNNEESVIRQLPVSALNGIDAKTRLALKRAGLNTIGALAERPQSILAARFGQDFITELMRTLGRENAGITPLRPRPQIAVARNFAEPLLQLEALEAILAELIAEASLLLQEQGKGGSQFEASFFRCDGAVRRLHVETGRPSRDVKSLMRLYRERFASIADPIDPGFGFDLIRFTVLVTAPLSVSQSSFAEQPDDESDVTDLIDRLVVRFGADRVLRFEPEDTHDPRRESRTVRISQAGKAESKSANAAWAQLHPGEPPLRPLQLFASPQPIEALAEVPDGPPLRFRWRRILHDVTRAEGPERIEPEWWRRSSDVEARDYYRIEDASGCRFWIFRQGHYGEQDAHPRWFLHGVFA